MDGKSGTGTGEGCREKGVGKREKFIFPETGKNGNWKDHFPVPIHA